MGRVLTCTTIDSSSSMFLFFISDFTGTLPSFLLCILICVRLKGEKKGRGGGG